MPSSADTEAVLTIAPPPAFIITGTACLMPSHTAFRSTATMRSNTSSGVSWISNSPPPMPALLNITSSRPNFESAVSTSDLTSSDRLTSTAHATARPSSPAASASALSNCMSPITTRAPSRTNRRVAASPIPDAPPVMTATLPSSRPMSASCAVPGTGVRLFVRRCGRAGWVRAVAVVDHDHPVVVERQEHARLAARTSPHNASACTATTSPLATMLVISIRRVPSNCSMACSIAATLRGRASCSRSSC